MQSRSLLFWSMLVLGLGVIGIWIIADLQGSVLIKGDNDWFQPIIYRFATTSELFHPFMSPIENGTVPAGRSFGMGG